MKRTIIAIIVFGLILTPVFAVEAQSVVRISLPLSPDYVSVQYGNSIELYTGWGTCTPGLAKLFPTAYNLELTINGAPLYDLYTKMNDPYWTPVAPHSPIMDWPCLTAPKGDQKSVIYWIYPLGILEPDTYVIHFKDWLNRRITDGYDGNSDGKLDYYDGVLNDRTITIEVYE